MQPDALQDSTIVEAKLQLAEQILDYSNRNIQLTIEMLVASSRDMEPLVELAENGAAISNLIQRIRGYVETDKERELLDGALSRTHSYAESFQSFVGRQRHFDATTVTTNIILPLLLDNSSWRVFVQFLRTQLDSGQINRESIYRTRQIVRAHQEMKSIAAERNRIAERLSQLASMIDCSSDAIIVYTLDGLIVSWNTAAEAIYGYSAGEMLGRQRNLLLEPDQPDDLPRIVGTLKRGESVKRFETVHVRKGGQRIDVSMTISPVKDAREQVIGAAAIARDVSDRKHLEKQLRQAQRMEAIGQLSGGIAHDFNNLLTIINGCCELLEPELPQSGPIRKNCDQIRKAGEKAASLTKQLLAFSRQQVLEPRVLDLNAVVLDLEKMLKRVIGEDIELRTVSDRSLGTVKADRSQIEQVIMNLIVNARDAMPNGGRLTIETANVVVDEAFARRHRPQKPGPYVRLSVRDTGIGMDAETQARIFEPFFTTKEVGKGTGLGLSTAYGVMRQSGGHIWASSQLGQGTTFEIYLPVVNETARNEKPGVGPENLARGKETILLVEDEEVLRELTRDLLVGNGYAVLEAESPQKAIQIASRHTGPIDLLLTDVVMPHMNGRALAQELTAVRPQMKVLYMSGYAGFMQCQVADSESMLLAKPFGREVLLRKIRDTLASSVESPYS